MNELEEEYFEQAVRVFRFVGVTFTLSSLAFTSGFIIRVAFGIVLP